MSTAVGRRVPLASPYFADEELDALRAPLESGWVAQGAAVQQFEREFAAHHGANHGVATSSCTAALHLSLLALGVDHGDEVIVPSFTWVASANAALYCGARPVLADVDPRTYNIDPRSVEQLLSPRTKAVVAVHLFGLPAAMDALRDLVPAGVAIVEDAACAAGAEYRGRSAGGLGDVAGFSFHARKVVTTGEGGMVTTSDGNLAARIGRLRNHGASASADERHLSAHPYLLPDFEELGFNYRLTDLQAALGLVQLGRLAGFVAGRRALAARYREALSAVGWLRLPEEEPESVHAWQSYVAVVDESAPVTRNGIMARLDERGIASRPGTHSIADLGYYRRTLGTRPEDVPASTALAATSLALPMHNRMTDDDVAYVAEALLAL